MSLKSQLEAIAKRINEEAQKSLNNNVSDKVIELGGENVQKVVYDAYEPKSYQRTFQLRDTSWESIPVECGVIIRNDRNEGDGYQIANIVETGIGYSIPDNTGTRYGFPRPFMQVTRDMLTSSNIVEEILIKDLTNNLGVKCRLR